MKVDYKYIKGSVDALLKLQKSAQAKYGDNLQGVRLKYWDATKAKGIIVLKDKTKHQMTVKA